MQIVEQHELKEALYCDKLCKRLGASLVKEYPNRHWGVHVHDKGHLCDVWIPELSMEDRFRILLTGSITVDEKAVKMAAGEILERFGLSKFVTDNSDLMSLARDHKGVIGAKKGEI